MKKSVVGIILLILLIVGGGIAAVYLYFKGSDKHLQLIPKDAMFVATVDFKSLAVKSDFNKIKELNWYKDMQKQLAEETKSNDKSKGLNEVINHPLSCGINLLSDVYIFAANQGSTGIAGGLIFDIKDADAFEKTIMKLAPDAKIQSASNYKWVEQNEMALAWSKTGAIVAGSFDKSGTSKLTDFLDATFKRSLGESILANDQFKKFNSNRKDISYFMNMNEFYTCLAHVNPDPGTGAMMSSMGGNFKDVYMWTNCDFQTDRVLTTAHMEIPEASVKALATLSASGLSEDHLKSITTKDCYMLIAMSCDPDKIFAMYESNPKIKESLDGVAAMTGMSTKDLEHIFGGEISIALTDFKKMGGGEQAGNSDDPNAMMQQQMMANIPMPVVTINFSSKNKEGLKKLLEGKLPLNADGYYHMNMYGYVNVNLAPNKFGFTLTNDDATAKTIAGGGTLGSLPANINDLAKNNPMVVYANLDWNSYPQNLRDLASQSLGDKNYKAFTAYMSIFKDFQIKGGQRDSEMALNLTPGSGNSLYRFFAQGDEVYKIMKQ
jgi:uncharacterized protein DUF4836